MQPDALGNISRRTPSSVALHDRAVSIEKCRSAGSIIQMVDGIPERRLHSRVQQRRRYLVAHSFQLQSALIRRRRCCCRQWRRRRRRRQTPAMMSRIALNCGLCVRRTSSGLLSMSDGGGRGHSGPAASSDRRNCLRTGPSQRNAVEFRVLLRSPFD